MMKKQSEEPNVADDGLGGVGDVDAGDEISFRPYVEALWSYRNVIGIGLLAVLGAFIFGSVYVYVAAPTERIGAIEFRLLFDGADRGQYPNGTGFSATEIVSTPVLTEVFRANELQRFGRFEDFKDALFIQQSNPEIDLLSSEYQAKLADARLTSVDRARLEEQFRKKREALTDPRFSLTLRRHERFSSMPRSLMEKILNDTLSTWAKQADERKGATKYDIPMFSQNVLNRSAIEAEDYLVGIDMLRAKARRIIDNIDKIAGLPGANVMRTPKEKISLPEVRANLEDIVRFKLEPLIGILLSEGLSKNPKLLGLYAQGQLFQIKLEREEAAGRVRALQQSLREYMAQRLGGSVSEARPGAGGAGGTDRGAAGVSSGSIIPQLGESFLDRLVELSTQTQTSDVSYRQKLTDQIIGESQNQVRLDRETAYYDNLSRAVKGMGIHASGSQAIASLVQSRSTEAFDGLSQGMDQLTAIYEDLSARNLNPSTLLYTITGPFVERAERSVSVRSILLYGVLVMMLAGVVIPVGCLIHRAFRKEAAEHAHQPAATL